MQQNHTYGSIPWAIEYCGKEYFPHLTARYSMLAALAVVKSVFNPTTNQQPTMLLIGIAGHKLSGKDTASETIAQIFTGSLFDKHERIAFADALKKEVALATGVEVEYINKEKALYRTILQWWGTELRRKHDVNYWTNKWVKEVQARTSTSTVVITVPDVRFQNEVDIIKELGGILWKVERKQYDMPVDNHASENDLNDFHGWDAVITNNGTLESFQERVTSEFYKAYHNNANK